VVLHLCDRSRLVPSGVVGAERFRIQQRIGASAQSHERIEIFGVRDFLEQLYRRKDRRDELYGLLPGETLR
jgi:hypothetical protein